MSGIASNQQQLTPIYLSTQLYQTIALVAFSSLGIVLFSYLRPQFSKIYRRRNDTRTDMNLSSSVLNSFNVLLRQPLQLDEDFKSIDSYLFLKFLKFNLVYNLATLLPGLGLIIVNYVGASSTNNFNSSGWLKIDMKQFTIEAIEKQPNLLWFHIGVAYFNNLLFLFLCIKFCRHYVAVRQAYFRSSAYKRQLHSKMLVVKGIDVFQLDTNSKLKAFFDEMDLNYQVDKASLLPNRLVNLQSLTRKYNQTILLLEALLSSVQINHGNSIRPSLRVGKFGLLGIGEKADGIDYCLDKLTSLHASISELKGPILTDSSSLAFLSFRSTQECHTDLLQLLPGPGTKLPLESPINSVDLMPGPNQLILENLVLDWRYRYARFSVSTLTFIGLLIGAAFLFSSLAYVGSSTTLASLFPTASSFFSQPALQFIIDGMITPLLMLVLIAAMQLILKRMARFQSAETKSSIDRRLLAKFLAFLVVDNLVVFSLLATLLPLANALGSIKITDFSTFILTFKSIIPSIGLPFSSALLSTSTFWVSQLGLRTLSYLVELIQPISLLNYINYKLRNHEKLQWLPKFNLTLRQQSEMELPPRFDFPIVYAVIVFNMTLIQAFGLVAPMILPYGSINFLVAYTVYRHQLTYVYSELPKREGRLAQTAMHSLLTLFTLIQFLNLLILLLKDPTDPQWLTLLPLPFLTVWWVITLRAWLNANSQALKINVTELLSFNISNPSERPTPIYPSQLDLVESSENSVTSQPSSEFKGISSTDNNDIVPLNYLTKDLLKLEVDKNLLEIFPDLNRYYNLTDQSSTESLTYRV